MVLLAAVYDVLRELLGHIGRLLPQVVTVHPAALEVGLVGEHETYVVDVSVSGTGVFKASDAAAAIREIAGTVQNN